MPDPGAAAGTGAPSVDLVLVLAGYPACKEELGELRDEGLFDLPDLWVSVYLAGRSVCEEPVAEAGARAAEAGGASSASCFGSRALEPPELLLQLHEAISAAELGSGLANSSILTLPESQTLAPPVGEDASDLCRAVLAAAREETERRLRFSDWLKGVKRVPLPEGPCDEDRPDTAVYRRLADTLDPSRCDVPSLLYCLCEQVASSLSGRGTDAAGSGDLTADNTGRSEAVAESCPEGHSGAAFSEGGFDAEAAACGEPCGHPELSHGDAVAGGSVGRVLEEPPPGSTDGGTCVLPYLDKSALLYTGHELPGGVGLADAVLHLISHLRAPGVSRAGFPVSAPLTKAQRSATRGRACCLLPEIPVAEIEEVRLHCEFEKLLEAAQPERRWCLADRLVHERIPAALLAPTLLEASQLEGFADTAYLPGRDCLLLALHHRAPPGRALWHSWAGDLLASKPLCPEPSFSDWWHQVAQSAEAGGPPPPAALLSQDARQVGYCRAVEKLLVPGGGSVILRTSLQRGLREPLPRPQARAAAGGSSGRLDVHGADKCSTEAPSSALTAPPRFELRSARVMHDGLTFGIVTDARWAQRVLQLRRAREEVEQAQEQATELPDIDALRQAQGLLPAEPEQAEESENVEDQRATTPKSAVGETTAKQRLEDLRFGVFWVAFRDGARCTARVHHERPWYPAEETAYDAATSRPGVLMTYTPTSGLVVQVFSDGSVQQLLRPRPQKSGTVGLAQGTAAPDAHEAPTTGLAQGGACGAVVSQTVTPFGVVVRSLLSGCSEIYHPDGTRAVRSPAAPGMHLEAESGLQPCAPEHSPVLREEPGHWRVTRPDGRRFGRSATLPAVAGSEAAGGPPGIDPAPLMPSEGAAVDAGAAINASATVEYALAPLAVTEMTDPHTGQRISTDAEGLLVVEDSEGLSRVCILPDGTRITRRQHAEGFQVLVEGGGAARATCHVSSRSLVEVECDDGARLQVVPQRLNHRGELVASEPGGASTNASALLRRRDGGRVTSRGDGVVEVLGGRAAAAADGPEAQGTVGARPGIYAARVDEDRLAVRDRDGNTFEVRGDQAADFQLAVSMGDDFPSPRCTAPGLPFRHPDASYLPLPEEAPPPRLFVIHGDGEAEELLPAGEVEEVLRQVVEDPSAVVLQGEPMGPPLEACRCHTVLRAATLGPATSPLGTLLLPPVVAAARGLSLNSAQSTQPGAFTEFRQFVEHPPTSDKRRAAVRAFAAAGDARPR